MKLSADQMNRQIEYSLTIEALESLHRKGILTDEEMQKSVKLVTEKYKPILRLNS